MALADRIDKMQHQPSRRCKAMQIYAELSSEDQAAFDHVVDMLREIRTTGIVPSNSEISASSLARALQSEGYEISVDTVQSHTYKRCGCRNASV